MASAYKNIGALIGDTGDVTIYTCPTATEAIVQNIHLYNSHSGTIVVYTKVTDSSASVTITLDKTSIGTDADTSLAGPFVLEDSDTLLLNCDVASKIYVFASVLELS
jgi:ethanolamine utilization microcompartment shell protein EutS|tara:strand:- start:346 stop:666 length:321 start_codon:yes stop_codon:yes gene_type:complete